MVDRCTIFSRSQNMMLNKLDEVARKPKRGELEAGNQDVNEPRLSTRCCRRLSNLLIVNL